MEENVWAKAYYSALAGDTGGEDRSGTPAREKVFILRSLFQVHYWLIQF